MPSPTKDQEPSRALAAACAAVLERVTEACTHTPPDAFVRPAPWMGGATIGQHVRHALDHVEQLVVGLCGPGGGACAETEEDGSAEVVDYDRRTRDGDLERDPQRAARVGARLSRALVEAVAGRDPAEPVDVRCACAADGDEPAVPSTLGRELQFLVNHTVHHLAMIGGIRRSMDLPVDDDFGVAPSTLRFRRRRYRHVADADTAERFDG